MIALINPGKIMHLKLISILVASTLLTACDESNTVVAGNHSEPHVNVVTLRSEPVVMSSQLPGRTVAVRTAEVRPQVNGILQKRLFTEGGLVSEHQQLYQIDPSTYQAAYNKAKATLQNAEILAKRYKSLAAVHAISAQDLDDAVSKAEQARADLDTARINLEYTKVNAPITGQVGRSVISEGALVTNGQSSYLTTITQLDPIYVDISDSSRNLLELRKMIAEGTIKAVSDHEASVKLILENGSIYPEEGRLEFSEVRVDEATGSVILRATFPNPDRLLLPGMFVHVQLDQGINENGILVPQEAISHDNKGRAYVYTVNQKSLVEQKIINTGRTVGDKWIVTSGLTTGDKVITAGLQRVSTGIKVISEEKTEQSKNQTNSSLTITDLSAQ